MGEEYLSHLLEVTALTHWTVELTFGPCRRFPEAASDCHVDYRYLLLLINVDPVQVRDHAHLRYLLRHEVLHAVASPFLLYRDVLLGLIRQHPELAAAEEVVWQYVNEQHVLNLERILDGLDDQETETE